MMESGFEVARAQARKDTFLSLNEETVKVALIVPMLRQLGWTDRDIKLEKTVGRRPGKRLDIALEAEQKRSIVIEIKAAKERNLEKFSGLITKQAALADFRYGAVTNGSVWVLYRIDGGTATKVATLSIEENTIEEFTGFFGCENVACGRADAYWNMDRRLYAVIIEKALFGPEFKALLDKYCAENHSPNIDTKQFNHLCLKMLRAIVPDKNGGTTEKIQRRDEIVEWIDAILCAKLGCKAKLRKTSQGEMTYYIGRDGVTVQVRVATARSQGYVSFNIVCKKEAAVKFGKKFKSELMKIATKHDIEFSLAHTKAESGNKRYEWLLKSITDADANANIAARAEKFACFASDAKKWLTGA